MSYWDWVKNIGNNIVQEVGKKFSPPPEKDVFLINGELSPNEFVNAGDHLIKICKGWQWKSSTNKDYSSLFLTPTQQYLQLDGCLCKRRLNKTLEAPPVKETEVIKEKEGEEEA